MNDEQVRRAGKKRRVSDGKKKRLASWDKRGKGICEKGKSYTRKRNVSPGRKWTSERKEEFNLFFLWEIPFEAKEKERRTKRNKKSNRGKEVWFSWESCFMWREVCFFFSLPFIPCPLSCNPFVLLFFFFFSYPLHGNDVRRREWCLYIKGYVERVHRVKEFGGFLMMSQGYKKREEMKMVRKNIRKHCCSWFISWVVWKRKRRKRNCFHQRKWRVKLLLLHESLEREKNERKDSLRWGWFLRVMSFMDSFSSLSLSHDRQEENPWIYLSKNLRPH